jgi:H+/Cl- antiporter ClcA
MALRVMARIRRWSHVVPLKRLLIVAAVCGLLSAIVGIVSGGTTYGTGYEQARAAIEGHAAPAYYFIEKLLATFLAMLSGIPGGFFAPSLSVGGAFGSTIAEVTGASIGLGAILGMAGYFSGVTQAPMTTFVIILEMTGNHRCIFPIMAASMLGYLASRIIMPEQFYHGMARVFVANVIRTKRAGHAPEH